MKREDLTKLGLTDDTVIDAIMAANGKDIEKHKSEAATLKTSADALQAQLTEAGTQIEGFKKLDPAAIQKAADDWKAKAEQAQADAQKQIAGLRFDHALESGFSGAKVKYSKEVLARLKLDELKDKDGNFIPERFETQIKTVKESASDLFESDTPTPRIVTGGNNRSVIGDSVVDAVRKAAGLPAAK